MDVLVLARYVVSPFSQGMKGGKAPSQEHMEGRGSNDRAERCQLPVQDFHQAIIQLAKEITSLLIALLPLPVVLHSGYNFKTICLIARRICCCRIC